MYRKMSKIELNTSLYLISSINFITRVSPSLMCIIQATVLYDIDLCLISSINFISRVSPSLMCIIQATVLYDIDVFTGYSVT